MTEKLSEKGNVIWLLLIGIMAFALLSFAITRGGSENRTILTKEQAHLRAEELVQYAASIKTAVDRIILYNGGDDTAISFAHPQADAAYGVYNSAPKNEVFNPAGGGAIYQGPPTGVNDGSTYEFMGRLKITGIGTGAAAAGAELTLVLFSVGSVVCDQINRLLARGWTGVPVNAGTITTTRFAGTYTNGDTVAGTLSELSGKHSFCFREAAGGQRYIFVYTLRAR